MQGFMGLLILVIGVYVSVLLLRVWMQWVRADFYNPFSQFIVKITQPVVGPLRRVIPSIGPIDTASVVLAYLLILLPLLINRSVFFGFSAALENSVIFIIYSFLELLTYAGKLLFWVLLARAILSWVSQGRNPVDMLLLQLTEPVMAPIRRVIPSFGMIDLSPMVVIFILYALGYVRDGILQWLVM